MIENLVVVVWNDDNNATACLSYTNVLILPQVSLMMIISYLLSFELAQEHSQLNCCNIYVATVTVN